MPTDNISEDVPEWRAMVYAPLDGRKVELLIRHNSWWTAQKAYPYSADEDWQQVVEGQWLDFNGGGWSWAGMAGTPIGWRPLPPAPPIPATSPAKDQ